MSQVWVERPAYYFWLTNAPCAYLLALEDSFSETSGQSSRTVGVYSLKSYPFRNSGLFNQFSKEEQLLVQSDVFDGTNTPRFERLRNIPDHYFNVGTIELAYSSESPSELIEISAESLGLIKTLHINDPLSGETAKNGTKGSFIREVPGWTLTHRLFDSLCLIHSFHYGKTPLTAVLSESAGFSLVCEDPWGPVSCVNDESSRLISISVNYYEDKPITPDDDSGIENESLLDGDFRLMIDSMPDPHKLQEAGHGVFANPEAINPLWWTIAHEDFKCNLNTPCGCS